MKFCKIRVIDHYHNLEDSIALSSDKEEGESYLLGVLDVVTEDFNPNSKDVLVEVGGTTDSYQIRPKMIKLKSGKLKYGSKSLDIIDKIMALEIVKNENPDEFERIKSFLK